MFSVRSDVACWLSSSNYYWLGLYKTEARDDAPTCWLDGNPSGYRWWLSGEPNNNFQCILYTTNGFRDRECNRRHRFSCKITNDTCKPKQGRGDGPEAGTSGASEAARASCRLGSPGVLPPPRKIFLKSLEILNAISCDLVHNYFMLQVPI